MNTYTADLTPDARKLMLAMVARCLKAQGLPSDRDAVAGAVELIDAGFAVIRTDGKSRYWLEAVDG